MVELREWDLQWIANRRLINSGGLVFSLDIPTRAVTVPSGYSTDVPQMTFSNLRKDVLLERAKKSRACVNRSCFSSP